MPQQGFRGRGLGGRGVVAVPQLRDARRSACVRLGWVVHGRRGVADRASGTSRRAASRRVVRVSRRLHCRRLLLQRAHRTWRRLRGRDLIRSGIFLLLHLPMQPRCLLLATAAAAAPPWAAAACEIPRIRTRSRTRSRTHPTMLHGTNSCHRCFGHCTVPEVVLSWRDQGRGRLGPPTQVYLIRVTMRILPVGMSVPRNSLLEWPFARRRQLQHHPSISI